jgi:hypothetical protein
MSRPISPTKACVGRWGPRRWLPPLVAVLALAAQPAMANGEAAITAQAEADHGAFLAYAPAPARRAGLCLIDTGVNSNPDTEGVVVERTAIDGGSGDDVSPALHGTVLAMMAGAAFNGWGMTGTAPSAIQIISVRILEPGQTTFPFSAYATGISLCLEMAGRFNIKTINLSLGNNQSPTSENSERVVNAIEEAHDYGVAVVAASGNDDDGAVGYPAAYPAVVSVAASDSLSGGLCSFSNHGKGLRLIAPGCELEGADPTTGAANFDYWQGTSEASVIAASALTALMSYRPDLTSDEAERLLTTADEGSLDISQTFRDAGLGQLVVEGEAAEPQTLATGVPSPGASATPSVTPSSPAPVARRERAFPAPVVRLKHRKNRLILTVTDRPPEALVQVCYLARRRRALGLKLLRKVTGNFTTLSVSTINLAAITVRYIDPYDTRRAGPWTTLRPPARRRPGR